MSSRQEVPPTAGLPPQWQDLWPADADFSDALAATFGLPSSLLECSGTAALVVTLHALKRHSARRVVVIPAYTCPLVVMAIVHCGLEVALCDTGPGSVDFDHDQLAAVFEAPRYRDRILAVIPTHLGGRVVDVAAVQKLAVKYGSCVIEDAAQALGATVNGKSVGLIGDAGFFSFAIGKGLNLFEGGALIANDPHLRQRLQSAHDELIHFDAWMEAKRCLQYCASTLFYRPFGLRLFYGPQFRRAAGAGNWVEAVGDRFGREIPLHTLGRWRQHCAAGALPRLPSFLEQTRTQGLARRRMLQDIAGITVIDDAAGVGAAGTWPVLMALLPSTALRDAALRRLVPLGLGAGRLFVYALPDYDYLRDLLPADVGACTEARKLAGTLLCISNSLWLDDAAFAKVLQILGEVMTAAS
ncbi:MAG TPA: DegT/DnrJ/EryC1/StrS family aminotransferase [Candidatus Acidoferrum sp.]|nr:DegT/DnrJ/EryC1/StrS family aminotransferase [Candidatus Acidoferrum sp.]